MQNWRDPSFFHTSTMALHQGDWLGRIAPVSNISLRDAWTSSSKGGGICLNHSLNGSLSLRRISCSIALVHPSSSGSSTKASWYESRSSLAIAALWGVHWLKPSRFNFSNSLSCHSCTVMHSFGVCASSSWVEDVSSRDADIADTMCATHTPFLRNMAWSVIFRTTINICLQPATSVVYACSTCNPGGSWHPLSCFNSVHPMGVTITCVSCVGAWDIFPSKISVWNGPPCMLFSISTTVSNSFSPGTSVPSAPFSGVPSATRHCDSNWARRTVDQGVEIQSISLSLITLMTHAKVQVPITIGTCLPKVDSSGTTRNTTSSSYPATSLTSSLAITNPKGHVHQPPSPTKCSG